jgi:hypothetical protein
MKITDTVVRFSWHPNPKLDGICRVRSFYHPLHGLTAVITDLGDLSPGRSVSNAIEKITITLRERGIVVGDVRWITHYEKGHTSRRMSEVTFDKAGNPSWEPVTEAVISEMTGASASEFQCDTFTDARVMREIGMLQTCIDPFFDFPELEPVGVSERRERIRQRMVPRHVVESAVEARKGERALSRLLSDDLSLLGEVYASPSDEYICFAEVPLGSGRVDFVVLTGRSVMEVVLIEVKGADFGLLNRGPAKKIADRISHAAQQVRARIGAVHRNYPVLRREFHKLRASAEQGYASGRFLVGPYPCLEVDPGKDVYVRGVVIGGRTRNDLEESSIRHEFQTQTSPPVKLDTWDTWLRRIRRE